MHSLAVSAAVVVFFPWVVKSQHSPPPPPSPVVPPLPPFPPAKAPLPPPPSPPATHDRWFWAGDGETCTQGCERFGYECDSIYSRDAATGMARQTTEDGLKEVMAEATVNSASVYNWLGGCGSWVSQAYSPLPFFRTGNGKCFSSGLNTNDPPDYG